MDIKVLANLPFVIEKSVKRSMWKYWRTTCFKGKGNAYKKGIHSFSNMTIHPVTKQSLPNVPDNLELSK